MSRSAALVPEVVGASITSSGGGTASKLTPGARAEVAAIVEQACGPSNCDSVRIIISGEELTRIAATDSQKSAERLIRLIEEDASTREAARHSYSIAACREDREVFRTMVRVMGGGQQGSAPGFSLEPSAQGALKLTLRHLEATGSLLVRSHAVTQESMARELERVRARVELLEDQNDALRAELRRALEGGRVDEAKAEQERRRTELIVHAGKQLLRYLPHMLKTWFPMPDDDDAPASEKATKLAPPEVAKALAAVTDDQLAATRDVLTADQLAIVERARSGGAVTLRDVVALADISDEAAARLSSVLRPDQFAALVDAMSVVNIPPAKG